MKTNKIIQGVHSVKNVQMLLAGIVILGMLIRLWGINFGLPFLYNCDEPTNVNIAQNIFKTGDLNPHTFIYPSLFFYIISVTNVPFYLIGKLNGIFENPTDVPSLIVLVCGVGKAPMPEIILFERIITTIFGCSSIILIFLIGRHITKKEIVGLLATLMMAVSPTNVTFSRFITPDTFLVFFVLLSFFYIIKIFNYGKVRYYAIAGFAVGLAASTKYNGGIIILPLLLAHFLRFDSRGLKDRKLYLAIFMSAIAFFLTTPFALFDYSTFIVDLLHQAKYYSTGHLGMEGEAPKWYLTYLIQYEGLIVLFAVLEILRGIYIRSKEILLISFFSVVYFIFISSFVVRNDRTVLPLIPFLLLLTSSFVIDITDKISIKVKNKTLFRIFMAIFMTLILIIPILYTVTTAVRLTTLDSRETARIWIDKNLPIGSRMVIESYSPYVDPHKYSILGVFKMTDHTAEWYFDNHYEYLIFSEGMFERFYRDPSRYQSQIQKYEELFQTFKLVKVFTDGNYEIRIYRIFNK